MSWTWVGGVQMVTEECCNCGMTFGMTSDFQQQRKDKTGSSFYCPAGHGQHYTGQSTRQQLEAAQARERHLSDQLHAAEADAEAQRMKAARQRYRFSKGVCPCCNRSFENVRRHMSTQHPDFAPAVTDVKGYRCSCGRAFETPHGLAIHQGRNRPSDWADPKRGRYSRHLTIAVPS